MAELIKIGNKSNIAAGSSMAVEVHGQQVAVFNVDGTFYALGGTCTHRGGPLAEGQIDGLTVTCPWHRAQFDLKTGNVLAPPAPRSVPTYKVVIEGDDLSIEL